MSEKHDEQVPALRFVLWLDQYLTRYEHLEGPSKALAVDMGMSPHTGPRMLWRWKNQLSAGSVDGRKGDYFTGTFPRGKIEQCLFELGVSFYEIYPELEPDGEMHERFCETCNEPVTTNGDRKCPWCETDTIERRAHRGVAVCVDDDTVREAHELHMAGMSYRRIAAQLLHKTNYGSEKAFVNSLTRLFQVRGLPRRNRVEACIASNVERGWRPQCSHVFKVGPRKGQRCERRCVGNDRWCWHHAPEQVEAGVLRLRAGEQKQIAA